MRGKSFYFYALKDDFITKFKEIEEKLGGMVYARHTIYKEPKIEIYNSIDEIPNLGIIKNNSIGTYFIALKNENFSYREVEQISGGINYFIDDKNGFLKFKPSSIYENTNCIIMGELSTVSKGDTRKRMFKELKKSMIKNMMLPTKGSGVYIGKSLIENKGKYRLLYGGIDSNPNLDLDISEVIWRKK